MVASWKPDDDLVPFDLPALEDGLDLDDGFMPVRIVFGDATRSGRLGHSPPMNVCDAPDDDVVRRVQPVSQLLIADLLLSVAGQGFARTGSRGRCAARAEVMAQFLDGHTGTKDPAFRVERCLRALLESGRVFQFDGDVVALFQRNGRGLFQDGVHANDYRLRRLRDAGKRNCPKLANRASKADPRLFVKVSLLLHP